MNTKTTRRQFTGRALALAAASFAAPALLRGQNLNSKLNVAVIGAGGRGSADTDAVAELVNIVALCDVDEHRLNQRGRKFPEAKKYTDFRQVFEHPEAFDAVIVATCEHTHAMATMLALKNKKHIYCEKPLTHDVWEARRIRETAAKTNVVTQMGIQIHANDNYRRVVELIQAGAIGPVHEAHVWVSRAWGLQSEEAAKRNKDIVYVTDRPKPEEPPDSLKWDLWLGPALSRPFSSVYVPGPKWYRWWDFGNGTMSDLGSHWNDLPFWALKLHAPLTVEASGPPPHPDIAPASMSATYEYGARGDMPPVKLVWHQGEDKPELWTRGEIPKWPDGVLFIGDKGMLLSSYDKHVLLPEKDFAGYKPPKKMYPHSPGHHQEWLNAIADGKQTLANFEYAGWLTEANHLGNVAFRVGRKLEWDADAMRATNAPDADQYLRRERRKGWEL
ncbi:MAG TPA: Gfo/Idh/MocA family oxidoreductase [Tepidisphaeraceae bacterium]|nr:Gfo/Idh/MocA family oxidoreductase [Tepidisphaeraceae bacterium]